MFKKSKICTGVLIALGGAAGLSTAPAFGQQLERVEITGSSVRRIDAESALPVVVLKREDIAKSGATSTTDLLNKLSSIQGSTKESASEGGETFGFSGISIHNIGEARTLVLLNGHRMALFGGQTLTGFAAGFDLNAIPVSAIERVEVLTDGASSLYGADAVAGVVNFITKHDSSEGDITVGVSQPKAGAKEKRISLTKGFGSLDADGYNAFVSFGHDERTVLRSVDRGFADTGRRAFTYGGQNYLTKQFSASPIPANVLDDQGQLISPYQKTSPTGSCPPKTFRIIEPYNDGSGLVDDYCGFNFVGELEIYPERKRDSLVSSFTKKLGEQELFAELLLSRTTQHSKIAPVPGGVSINAGTPLFNQYLAPLGITQDTTAFYRVYDLGGRTSDDIAKFYDVAIGARGTAVGWDYKSTLTMSKSEVQSSISGYPGGLAFGKLLDSGNLDPFVGPGQQSAVGLAALNAINFKGYWNGGTSKLTTLSASGSRELATLPAGPLMLGTGANFNLEKFQSKPSLYAQGLLADPVAGTLCDVNNPALPCDQRFGDSSTSVPYSADRKSYGVFGELTIPALKTLEFGTAVRYDHYNDFGNATTAKGSFRWTPSKDVLFRGSVGSGFHAPTVPQVNASAQPYGVTSDKYACSAAMLAIATSLGAECRPGQQQYDQIAGGNKNLLPEKSINGTLGLRLEPTPSLTVGADLWHVGIKDAFGQLNEAAVFANPNQYPKSWGTNRDIAAQKTYLAFIADNQNLGKYFATGIDFDVATRSKTDWGDLSTTGTVTYMIREDQQLEKNGQYYSAIGKDSPDIGIVTFRWQGRASASLKSGAWANTLSANFKSGYTDRAKAVDIVDAAGNVTGSTTLQLAVEQYLTWDWQTQWTPTKSLALTFGILNVLNTDPPLSLGTSGTNRGQQFGYDDRYYDARGRTFYLNASYKF